MTDPRDTLETPRHIHVEDCLMCFPLSSRQNRPPRLSNEELDALEETYRSIEPHLAEIIFRLGSEVRSLRASEARAKDQIEALELRRLRSEEPHTLRWYADRAKSTQERDGLLALELAGEVLRMYVEEVARLRSDEWLKKAAEEIAALGDCVHGWDYAGICTVCLPRVFRKHRDAR